MSTKINLEYNGNAYTLEYSRTSVRQMEDQGFVVDQLSEKPVTMVPMLVYGAFIKHHKGIKRSLVDEIYDHVTDKIGDGDNGFIHALLEMYAETVTALTDSKSADEGNRAVWKVTRG
jgi:hypothetical protein